MATCVTTFRVSSSSSQPISGPGEAVRTCSVRRRATPSTLHRRKFQHFHRLVGQESCVGAQGCLFPWAPRHCRSTQKVSCITGY